MSADAAAAFDPASFDPAAKTVVRRTSALVENRKSQRAEQEASKLQQRKKNSVAAFQQGYGAELNPYILIDTGDSPTGKQPNDASKSKPQVVRRRILVEPVFGRMEKNTGHGESMFRQIILDQGITDTSLVEEINRGNDNEYELGTELQLRNVHDYVDYSSEALVTGFIKEHAVGNVLLSATFRYLVLLVIIVNAVLIGLGTDNYLNIRYGIYMEALENIIMAAFVIEILFKWYYNFEVFWKGGWNILDFVIVMILFFGSSLKFLGSSRVLRILRVIRAFRSLRDTPLFSGLSLIFQTVARSVSDMANIIPLMLIMICLLGVVGVQLFGDAVPLYFGSFSDAVFSIFICQTQRGWVRIYNLFIAAGGAYFWGGFIYFIVTITLTSFVLKNLFVAVVVTNLRKEMKAAQEERDRKEAKKNKVKPSTKKTAGVEEDGEDGEDEEEGEAQNKLEPLIAAAQGWNVGDTQRRVLLPMFLNLVTLEDLQKYLFLQVALEENLSEYQKLRARLKDIYGEVHHMNESYFSEMRKKSPQQANNQPPKRRSKV